MNGNRKMKESDSSNGLKKKSVDKYEYDEGEDDGQPKNSASSSDSTVEESERNKRFTGVRQYVRSKMPWLRWTPDLHLRFVHAIKRLGGQERATPKLVLLEMNIKGLSLTHVKSHLQMYRSKKIDHKGQVIKDKGYLLESGDHNGQSPNQLHILQGFDQRIISSFSYSDASWSRTTGNWRSSSSIGRDQNIKASSGFYSSVSAKNYGDTAGRTITNRKFYIDNSNLDDQTSIRTYKAFDEFHLLYDRELCQTLIRPNLMEPNFTTQLQARGNEKVNCVMDTDKKLMRPEEERNRMKRKSIDCDLDLNLSLNVRSGRDECQNSWEEEEIDNNLSLSLFSPLKKERYSADLNQSSNLRRLKEDDSRKNSIRESTLGLTI